MYQNENQNLFRKKTLYCPNRNLSQLASGKIYQINDISTPSTNIKAQKYHWFGLLLETQTADLRLLHHGQTTQFILRITSPNQIFKALASPTIYLHLIFAILQLEISILTNWIFFLVWTGFFCLLESVFICNYFE